MNISGSSPSGGVDAADAQTVIVAARQLSQTKQDGANALAMIQSAAPPASDGVRGTQVNVMA